MLGETFDEQPLDTSQFIALPSLRRFSPFPPRSVSPAAAAAVSRRATSPTTCPKPYSAISLSHSPAPLASLLTDLVFYHLAGGGDQPP